MHYLPYLTFFLYFLNARTRSDLVLRREKRVSTNPSNGNKKDWGMHKNDSRSNNGTTHNDNRAQLLSQLPPSTKVETILKTEPLDPETNVQNHASGSQPYIGGDGTEFFPDIETPGSAVMPIGGGGMHALEDDDFLNSIQPVGAGQAFHSQTTSNHNNIKKEVDIYNEYQVCMCLRFDIWDFCKLNYNKIYIYLI